MDERSEQIEGLRLLADFLEGHTTIPVPDFDSVSVGRQDQIADWVDGLDDVELAKTSLQGAVYVFVLRRFGGLTLRGFTRSEFVSLPADRYEVVSELQPLTPRQVIDGYEAAVRGVPVDELPVIEATEDLISGF